MPRSTRRACPVCKGYKNRAIHHQSFADGPLGEGYDVVVCVDCGCGFADGIPTQATLDRYYAEQSKYTYSQRSGLESPWDFKRFEATVDCVLPFLSTRDVKILDVGCATGGLLSVFKRQGFTNIHGIDPSPRCAEIAAKIHGVSVMAGNLGDFSAKSERFDLILMLGVIEHIHNASAAIATARGLLNDGGKLYCAVPDVERLVDCPNAPYQQFSVEHINFFSTVSLNNLHGAAGMSPLGNWQWTTEWSEGVMEPIASGIYTPSAAIKPCFDTKTLPALEAYLQYSAREELELFVKINELRESQEPVFVWGAGTLARRLIAVSSLASLNIVAFVDSNPQLAGKRLAGIPILAPSELKGRPQSILICSKPFQAEILSTIFQLELPNRIIPFAK